MVIFSPSGKCPIATASSCLDRFTTWLASSDFGVVCSRFVYNFSITPSVVFTKESKTDCEISGSLPLAMLLRIGGDDSCERYVCDGVGDDNEVSFPKRFNSAHRLGRGASEPLANMTERHSWEISLINKPGDNRRRVKWHSQGGRDPLQ